MSGLAVPRELLQRYAIAAPRYTSYPTAVDWNGNAGSADWAQALTAAATRPKQPLALYVHVPFCEALCLYCGCNVHITRNTSRGPAYVELLEKELHSAAAAGLGVRKLTQHHWGGGTPTWLPAELLERLFHAVSSVFQHEPGAEIAIEVDPRVTSMEQLALLGRLGFNRLSLGVQDFDPVVQAAVHREQSFELTRDLIVEARARGFRSVNVDLIYGLPHQTRAGFASTVQQTLSLAPDRVALFHYAHVPWLKKHQRAVDQAVVPGMEEKFAIFADAVAAFTAAGYVYIGLDHFARPDDEMAVARAEGTLQRNFMGYSTRAGSELLPLGVSAIGEMDGAYFQNEPELFAWQQRVADTGAGVVKGHRLSAEDQLRRAIIMELMCRGELNFRAWSERLGVEFAQRFATELADLPALAQDGLIELEVNGLRVTQLGQAFLRNVAVVFDSYWRRRSEAPQRAFSRTL
jgi:oxygen-independent coproporphyrinogen-3 oxidase